MEAGESNQAEMKRQAVKDLGNATKALNVKLASISSRVTTLEDEHDGDDGDGATSTGFLQRVESIDPSTLGDCTKDTAGVGAVSTKTQQVVLCDGKEWYVRGVANLGVHCKKHATIH